MHVIVVWVDALTECVFMLLLFAKTKYMNRLKAGNLLHIGQLVRVMKGLEKVLGEGGNAGGGSTMATGASSEMVLINALLVRAAVDNVDLFRLLRYMEKSGIANKVVCMCVIRGCARCDADVWCVCAYSGAWLYGKG